MNQKTDEKMVQKIVLERVKSMSSNVKIALGSEGKFLGKDELIKEVRNSTPLGKKIIQIQFRYLKALKEGIV